MRQLREPEAVIIATAAGLEATDLINFSVMPGLFYKGRSQEKNLSHGRNFSCFAAPVNEQDLF